MKSCSHQLGDLAISIGLVAQDGGNRRYVERGGMKMKVAPTRTRMGKHTLAVSMVALSGFMAGPGAVAAEHSLEFRLVIMPVEVKTFEIPNIEGQNVSLMKMNGVAIFKDGRVAAKNFIFQVDYSKGSGPFFGYSTYTFEDGSSITARFAGTQRTGQPVHGEYTVLSGTGAYVGVKGSGTFDGAPHKLTGANLLNGKFSLTTP